MITKEFITAGRAIFTLEMPIEFSQQHKLPSHYTYRVRKSRPDSRYGVTRFVYLLTGPNNESDYTYLGILSPQTGSIKLTKKSAYPAGSYPVRLLERALCRIWEGSENVLVLAGFRLHHEGRCGRCGRLLTVPESIELGIGPECANKMHLAGAC